ncbi:multidrug ABC transporter ATPase [Agrilactobacillus composti DSM 18527 = JCM 14202]|uniref:Multidrug ABC transporter ATPase n=1 Tax=Agrilactobacillus composti DSM 18527 = JCM 14202 TaxID=1423734 RepID=X0PIE8_9LACO|nr:ABC transporter ATP-binding protein [Agrilactobacillus composti]KRM33372.1 multidrug ABC transporter ATPase [Agrilactobacillus composti DSM 18527 = JCM 14202]GAF41949.1 ABC transporter, ATP-binding protein [Agrilactobacillus composti DSM 18527 = JCM 14202]
MTLAIKLTNVHKRFNQHLVLKGINLEIKQGEIIGLLGANGAGKSTLIKIMTGLLKIDAGEVQILGHSLTRDKRQLRGCLGIAPQEIGIYPQLTVKQNLQNFGALNGLSMAQIKPKYSQVITIFDLKKLENQRAVNLSGGQKRRLHSAIALMSHARIIFLDEPTVGADVDSRNQIIQAVKSLSKQGITIIYTTHYLQEMAALNAKIVFLNHGTIQTTGSLQKILQQYAHPSLELYFHKQLPNLKGWKKVNDHLQPINNTSANYIDLLQQALANPEVHKQQLTNIKILKADLESAYHTLLNLNV